MRPVSFSAIATVCDGLPAPADELARLARRAGELRPIIEVSP